MNLEEMVPLVKSALLNYDTKESSRLVPILDWMLIRTRLHLI